MKPKVDRLDKMEAQLERWSARIDRVAARTEVVGAFVSIEEHHRIDELRVRRAIAQARFEAYRTADPAKRESQGMEDMESFGDSTATFVL